MIVGYDWTAGSTQSIKNFNPNSNYNSNPLFEGS